MKMKKCGVGRDDTKSLLMVAFKHASDEETEDAIRDIGGCVSDWCNVSNDFYPELKGGEFVARLIADRFGRALKKCEHKCGTETEGL